jgi:hypothetical protein
MKWHTRLLEHFRDEFRPRPDGDAVQSAVPVLLLIVRYEQHRELALDGFVKKLPPEHVVAEGLGTILLRVRIARRPLVLDPLHALGLDLGHLVWRISRPDLIRQERGDRIEDGICVHGGLDGEDGLLAQSLEVTTDDPKRFPYHALQRLPINDGVVADIADDAHDLLSGIGHVFLQLLEDLFLIVDYRETVPVKFQCRLVRYPEPVT